MASIAAAAARRGAAARHVAPGIFPFRPLFPRRGFAAGTTLPAARRTRPLPSAAAATASATRLLRRGLRTTPDVGSMNYVPICWVNPEAPIDPATTFNHGEVDLASEEAMWALYERWCAFHGVERDRDDMLRRFGSFKDKARSIHEFNQSGASYTMQLGEGADRTPEERAKFALRGRRF
ncbi:unnamed protein product [Urochloa decumbens]|uniref:Cathepsin propeptide inhibitor domain-containing protein n=1 Tax=Urochloa decumbens TaxID=240449 RepID=A0ABC8WAM5_9POAL